MHTKTEPEISTDIAAEAADWIARLHGPACSEKMARECLAWMERSRAHRHAFERCTAMWEEVRGLTQSARTDTAALPPLRVSRA
jgi:transmembrane sensor